MVSAVHLPDFHPRLVAWLASKGLHMVSAVHRKMINQIISAASELQRGCTWLVQFICGLLKSLLYAVFKVLMRESASSGGRTQQFWQI